MLLALTGLLAYARHRPTENPLHPFKPQPQGCRKQCVVSSFCLLFLLLLQKRRKSKNYFIIKCTFLSLYLRGKEKEKYQKKEKTRYRSLRSYERGSNGCSKQSLHSYAHYRCYARKYFVGKHK